MRLDNNSAESQRMRLLKHLREIGPITTLGARHRLDCMHPSQRLLELRRMGHRIVSSWVWDVTPEGGQHRVAKYALLPRKQLTLEDFLLKKQNPEAAATGSGAKQNNNLDLENTLSECLDQEVSHGGTNV